MQALIAPLLAGGAGAAATGAAAAGTAAAAASPFATLATAFQVASPVLGGIGAYKSGKAAQQQAEANAFIGETRARQTDTVARQGLDSELGEMRAALGANQQRPGVGTNEVFRELRKVRGRERRIGVGADRQVARDYGAAARAQTPGLSLLGGIAGAGQPLYDLYQLRKNRTP